MCRRGRPHILGTIFAGRPAASEDHIQRQAEPQDREILEGTAQAFLHSVSVQTRREREGQQHCFSIVSYLVPPLQFVAISLEMRTDTDGVGSSDASSATVFRCLKLITASCAAV